MRNKEEGRIYIVIEDGGTVHRDIVPMGFFTYGSLFAIQTLWAGPWLITVAGYTPEESAQIVIDKLEELSYISTKDNS